MHNIKCTWPFALALIWYCSWPILDLWSDHLGIGDLVGHENSEPAWFDTQYTKWGMMLVLIAGGMFTCWREWLGGFKSFWEDH